MEAQNLSLPALESRSAAAHQIRIIPKPFRMEELREALATVTREHAQETL